jgi:hypothetical protein
VGWTKHPEAIRSLQGARSEALSEVKKLAKALRFELDNPSDVHGFGVHEIALGLFDELRRFVRLREAVGGDHDESVGVHVDLLLQAFHSFKWSTHVRYVEPQRAEPRVHRH